MSKVIGVVPAGGEARRIHSFFKEMLPIAVDERDRSKFIISSERIIQSIIAAGATRVHFVLHPDKTFINEYYTKQELFPPGVVELSFLAQGLLDLGMPYTIDSVFDKTKEADYVLLGMPDTVLEPPSSFAAVLKLIQDFEADLALGLYDPGEQNLGGYIEFDDDTKIVKSYIDKESPNFPTFADNAWAVVAWSRRFNLMLHDELQEGVNLRRLASRRGWAEILFGDVIDFALQCEGFHVVADFVSRQHGFFWDISEPDKYFDLLRSYSPMEGHFRSK